MDLKKYLQKEDGLEYSLRSELFLIATLTYNQGSGHYFRLILAFCIPCITYIEIASGSLDLF